MEKLAAHDRLQPSLLERLADDEPHKKKETREDQIQSLNQLKEVVVRDLSWLLNCNNIQCAIDLTEYPEVQTSVLNYGVPGFAGSSLSTTDLSKMESSIYDAIVAFEPRIIAKTVTVSASLGKSMLFGRKTVSIEIGGKIWAQPYSLEFLLQSELDLDTGAVVSVSN